MGNVTEILSRRAMLSFDYHDIEKYPNLWKVETKSRTETRYMLFDKCLFTKIILDDKLILDVPEGVTLANNADILQLSNAYIKRITSTKYYLYFDSNSRGHTLYVGAIPIENQIGITYIEHTAITRLRSPVEIPSNMKIGGPNGISGHIHTTALDMLSKFVPPIDTSTFEAYSYIRVPIGSLNDYNNAGYNNEKILGISEFNFSLDFTEDYVEDFSEDYLTYVEALQNAEESEQEENEE